MGISQFESIVNSTMEMLNRREQGIKKFALKNLKKAYENNEWVYKFKEDEASILEKYYAPDQLNKNGIPFEFIDYIEKYNNESIDLSKKVIEKIESIKEKDLIKIGIRIVYATPEDKLAAGIELSESNIEEMVWERDNLYEEEGDSGRWTTRMTTVVKGLDGKNYAILWYRGLTEYQENEYYNQPRECKLEEEIITITKTNIVYLDN